jgi:digeranylgeranylglycerophospholipid reductase
MKKPSKIVDVLVVGGGPAGCRAALSAAKAGARVLLVEKQSCFGADPRCAEWVPQALGMETSIPQKAIVQPVSGMELHLPGFSGEVAMPGYMLERRIFDFELARQAMNAGAELWAAARLEKLEPGRAWIKQGMQSSCIGFSALVAADGASSQVAGFCEIKRQPVMAAINLQVPLKKVLDTTRIYLRPEYRLGYAWLFPKGDMANLGLGCVKPNGVRDLLAGLQAELVQEGVISPGVLSVSAGALPVGGPRPELFGKGVFFCGDAAGLAHAITGAGIPQALDSGMRAGKAACAYAAGDLDAGEAYAKEVSARWGGYLTRGLKAREKQDESWNQENFRQLMARTWPAWPKNS